MIDEAEEKRSEPTAAIDAARSPNLDDAARLPNLDDAARSPNLDDAVRSPNLDNAARSQLGDQAASGPPPVADDGTDNPILWAAIRYAPSYLALTTATVLWWSYLVFGEFVLAGLPEWLGLLIVVALGGAGYLALERRLAIYLPHAARRTRVWNWLMIGGLCAAGMIASIILGTVLPESAITLFMLAAVGVVTWWKGRKRRLVLIAIEPESSSMVAIRAVLVGLMTLAAVILLVTRVSGS